jgi:deferrochelatase/peroxidase EfeB
MSDAKGVLPDSVIRDYRANAALVFVDLADLDQQGLEAWLKEATKAVSDFADDRDEEGNRISSVATGFGPSFFGAPGSPRFALDPGKIPVGFTEPIDLAPAEQLPQHDVLFYVMTLSESALVEFLQALEGTRPLGLAKLTIERGFQRRDKRELFGFRDGLRNPRDEEREQIAFIDSDTNPDEPDWTEGGTYAAYLKVEQHFDVFAGLDEAGKQQVMGRKLDAKGTRLDRPDGSDSRGDGAFADSGVPPMNSHVRKVGPRLDPHHDAVKVFRRGVPYHEVDANGGLCAGLQFISFQHSLDLFETIYRRWMFNAAFPLAGTGNDALVERGLITVRKGAVFFIPPYTGRKTGFIGSGLFKPAKPSKPVKDGRLVIRKRANDPAASLAGISFQLLNTDGVTLVGAPFVTNAAGRAKSEKVPLGDYLVQETAPANLQANAPLPVTLSKGSTGLVIGNSVIQPGVY